MQLPDKKRGDNLAATHVNSLNSVARSIIGPRPGSNIHTWGGSQLVAPQWMQRLAIVIDPESEPSSSPGDSGSSTITCEGEATIRFRYFDPDIASSSSSNGEGEVDSGWRTDDSPDAIACLDYKAAGIEEPPFGTILTVWWDAQRGSWIPLISTGDRAPVRVSWSGSWEYDTNKTVSVMGSDETIKARNMHLGIGTGEGWIAFGEPDAGDVDEVPAEAFLISFDHTKVNVYEYDRIQFFGHDDTGIAEWFDGTSCEPDS